MKEYLLKGLAICTFFCTMIALPSRAEICFLPSGVCDQEAKPTEGGNCDEVIKGYHKFPVDGLLCEEVYINGCKAYNCSQTNCRTQGYDIGPTTTQTPPRGDLWNCKWCLQGSNYWWQCTPILCEEGLTHERNCPEGQEWREVVGAKPSYYGACGKCEEICPDGNCTDEDCPEGYSASKPESGCYKCDTLYLDEEKTKACYRCHRMNEDYVTATQKDALGEGCYSYDEETTDVDPICYLPTKVTCADDEWLDQTELSDGRTKCDCRDCTYSLTADETMRYTAAGGAKTNNVVSKRICGENNENHSYVVPEKVGDCDISKSESGVLTVTCPPNLTTTEKRNTFVIKQYKKDGETLNKEITVTVIVDPDTCVNPEATVAGCGQPGYARFDDGPRPACYKTKLEDSCEAGEVSIDSGAKSIAGQTCYYCVKNTCPTEDFTLGETPTPAEGYDTEQTDAGNNCYKIKPCDEGYDTAYQSENDCGNKQHPEGWIYESKGMSGNLKCGKCTPKVCKGDGFTIKCEAQPRCTNEADDNCGYKDLSKEGSVEYEGDTPKYNCNIKDCPPNTQTSKIEDCGTNVPVGKSGEQTCYRHDGPNTNCDPGFKYDYTQCQCVCDLDQTCPEGQALNKELCACQDTCVPGDGFFGSACCKDTDCKSSDEFPLYCFKGADNQGRCYECDTVADCSFEGAPRDRFFNKYGNVTAYPAYHKVDDQYVYDQDKSIPLDYSHRDECTGGQCIYVAPEVTCAVGDGKFGSGCCVDTDCDNGDEFPLYCFNAPAIDGTGSGKSCRECGALSDCYLFAHSVDRFWEKCKDCSKVYDSTTGRGKEDTRIYEDRYGNQRIMQIFRDDLEDWEIDNNVTIWKNGKQKRYRMQVKNKPETDHSITCYRGECATYDNTYNGNDTELAKLVYGKDDEKCPAGSSKTYPSGCDAKDAVAVGKTEFGSFCWACPK